MANKVQKIREEVEKLKSQLLRGACSSQVAMETRCKEEAYNEVLGILDTMQEEPVSEGLEKCTSKTILEGANFNKSWYEHPELALEAGAKWQKQQMMSGAVDGKIYETQARSKVRATTTGYVSNLDYKVGEKVKLLIIKED